MELTLELVQSKLAKAREAEEQAFVHWNQLIGARQVLEDFLAVLEAPAPE